MLDNAQIPEPAGFRPLTLQEREQRAESMACFHNANGAVKKRTILNRFCLGKIIFSTCFNEWSKYVIRQDQQIYTTHSDGYGVYDHEFVLPHT